MPLCLLLVLALAACDAKLGVDFPLDADADVDAETDPVEEPAEDVPEEEPEPCEYPSGPYAFTAVGDTVAPMSWPSAVARPDDDGHPADLENLYCDADVHSIFIQAVLITCSACPGRMAEIASHRYDWEMYGAKWIFIVADATTPAEANAYTEAQGVSFGWSTNDADNSAGTYAIRAAPIHGGTLTVPWTGVIRASDMQIYGEGSSLAIEAVAIELAP
jgi:hypothetical protein